MTDKIVLINREDYNSFTDEAKYNFIKDVFLNIGLPVEGCYPENYKEQTVKQRIELRELLKKFNVILSENSREMAEIIVDGKVIAKWSKPFCTLKQDYQTLDPQKKYYLEVKLDCYSIFDEQ